MCERRKGEKKGSARGSVRWGFYYDTAIDTEVDAKRRRFGRRFGRRKSDFALQRLVECSALEMECVRLVALRWHSSGSEVRFGLPVGL